MLPSQSEREELLKYEEWLGQVMRQRKGGEQSKPWHESGLVTAIMTGVLAMGVALVTGWITLQAQRDQIALQSDYARASSLLDQKRILLSDVNELLAVLVKSTEERLKLARREYGFLPANEIDSMRIASNIVDDRWRVSRDAKRMELALHFPPPLDIRALWDSTRDALNSYQECVQVGWRLAQKGAQPSHIGDCRSSRAVVDSQVEFLRDSLIAAYYREVLSSSNINRR